jgi:uncharacterized membrane protein YgcG
MLLALFLAATFPDFTGYVVDRARVIDPSAAEHVTQLASQLDHAGIAQIAVCTVPESALGDLSLEDYAVALFQKWGLGHGKKRDDGLLVLFVPGPPGHRKIRIEVGYGLEGILPDGKVGQIRTQYAFPYMKQDDYSGAAVHVVDALAAALEKDAAAGGDAAPAKDGMRGGTGVGMRGYKDAPSYGGLGITILCMAGLALLLASSGARRRFPGRRTQLAGAGLTAASVASLVAMGSGPGWLALVAGLILNAVIWASIRAHKCPKDGSWMTIEEEILDAPTHWSQGVAHVRHMCTNPRCGYRREYDKVLPRKQTTIIVGGGRGGGWGGGGGGGGGGFSGGGGGRSGGGGASGEV